MPKLQYDNWNAIQYAKEWSTKESNSCGVYLKQGKYSDCAHFVAHCLVAGGLKIVSSDPAFKPCPHGLAVRNVDLVSALRKHISDGAENIREIGLADSIVGDIGFLDRPDRPYHAFMVCTPVNLTIIPPPAVRVWAHSVRRSCEPMDAQWRQWFSTLFRIEDHKP